MAIRDWKPAKLGAVWAAGLVVFLLLYQLGHLSYWKTAPEWINLVYGLLVLVIPIALIVLGFLWFRGWRHRKRAKAG
jgi:hypothetical protein